MARRIEIMVDGTIVTTNGNVVEIQTVFPESYAGKRNGHPLCILPCVVLLEVGGLGRTIHDGLTVVHVARVNQ